jgi:hypothetical protein
MARKKVVTFNIVYRKLGKEKAYGIADHNTNTLEIDSRLIGKKHLEILLHEGAHLLLPEMNEEGIVRLSASLTRLLWEEGYRRIDNRDVLPLQDER